MIRGQHWVISALYLDTSIDYKKIHTHFPSSANEKALNTEAEAVIQLCVSVSKGQLAISTVSPSLCLI